MNNYHQSWNDVNVNRRYFELLSQKRLKKYNVLLEVRQTGSGHSYWVRCLGVGGKGWTSYVMGN